MKIFITGASGFIGTHLTLALLKRGHSITVLSRNRDNSSKKFGGKVRVIEGDINKISQSTKKIINSHTTLIHLAAFRSNWGSAEYFYKTNSDSLDNLISKQSKIKHIIATSSVYVHGASKKLPIDESSALLAKDMYGKTKIALEDNVSRISNNKHIKYTIIRPAIVYGPGDGASGMVMKLVGMLAKNKFFYIGNGENTLHLVHIDDLVQGYIRAVDHKPNNQVYILAGKNAIKLSSLVKMVQKELKQGHEIKQLPRMPIYAASFIVEAVFTILDKMLPGGLPIEPPLLPIKVEVISNSWRYSILKAKKDLGYKPSVSYNRGVKSAVKWYLKSSADPDML